MIPQIMIVNVSPLYLPQSNGAIEWLECLLKTLYKQCDSFVVVSNPTFFYLLS